MLEQPDSPDSAAAASESGADDASRVEAIDQLAEPGPTKAAAAAPAEDDEVAGSAQVETSTASAAESMQAGSTIDAAVKAKEVAPEEASTASVGESVPEEPTDDAGVEAKEVAPEEPPPPSPAAAEADASVGEEDSASKEEVDFASMLDESDVGEHTQEASVGDKVSGVLIRIGEEHSFVDFGGRSEGVIATSELRDPDGAVAFGTGDPLEAFVLEAGGETRLSRSLKGEDRDSDALYQAFKSGVPVEGKVTAVNKWGLGIDIQGVRAFCPVSQIDVKFVKDATEYRGKSLQFRIIRFRDRGRNIVVSRRALLEEERDKEANTVREGLTKGAQLDGTVTRLEPFGAFVDVGAGVEGLVHVSEMRHERVQHPSEVVEKGNQVRVVVLEVKDLGHRRKERISLSLKALEADPWDEIKAQFAVGTVAQGTVQALEEFGAFVELAPNVRGLVHVSEMADRRIAHPREVASVGDEVKVAVLEVDSRRRRLRLSMRQAEQVEDQSNLREFNERQRQEHPDTPDGGSLQDALRRAQLID